MGSRQQRPILLSYLKAFLKCLQPFLVSRLQTSITRNCTMPFPASPEDRPDPLENMPAMRARIPEHIARGEISTGVIVVTGGTEYVLDFVRNLPRPNLIVARVVLPHMVMPQFIDALAANVELFRQRYGELPGNSQPTVVSLPLSGAPTTPPNYNVQGSNSQDPNGEASVQPSSTVESNSVDVWPGSAPGSTGATPPSNSSGGSPAPANDSSSTPPSVPPNHPPNNAANAQPPAANPNQTNHLRRQNPQEVYDDLKLRDEILSGAYANAVMIGHGPFEFSFDFITNFYPQSAVSCRVYLASGHIHRLLESLRASWEQLRPRLSQGNQPPNSPPPTQPPR